MRDIQPWLWIGDKAHNHGCAIPRSAADVADAFSPSPTVSCGARSPPSTAAPAALAARPPDLGARGRRARGLGGLAARAAAARPPRRHAPRVLLLLGPR